MNKKDLLKDTDFLKDFVDNNKAIAVLGECDSGKTNLAFFLAELCGKKKYLLGYPKKKKGYTLIGSTDEFKDLNECVLIIDEFSRYFPVWEKKSNEKLLSLLQFAEQNRIKLILTTQLSQFITKQCEAYIPCWAMKQLNVRRLKNGSTPSYALKYVIKNPNVTADYMKVAKSEFVWYNEQGVIGENGIYNFPNMNVGKDWGKNLNKEKEEVKDEKSEEKPKEDRLYEISN